MKTADNIFKGLYLALLIVTCCCNTKVDENVNERDIRRTYYQNGTIKAEATYNSDSVKDGYGKLFYPNGTLELEISYVDGKKEGYEKGYYENGSIRYIGTNKNDLPVGEHLNFYENGNLKDYILYDPVGRVVYKREYDTEEKFVSEQGSKYPQIISVTAKDNHFKVGDTLKTRVYAPTPPNTKCDLLIKILNNNGELIEENSIPIEQGVAEFNKVLKDTGSYYFTAIYSFNDKLNEEKENHENNFQYKVN